MGIKVCFLGGARYGRPLDTTSEKKFRALNSLAEVFVIGFSQDLRLQRFTEHAHFYLLPQLPLSVLRYLEVFILGQILACWLIYRHGVQVLIAQSPYEGVAAACAKNIVGWVGYKVGLVVESHGDFEESLFMQRRISRPGLYRFVMLHTARYALKHADSLRVISNSTRQQLERWIPGKRMIQFPAWTDIETFLQSGSRAKSDPVQAILYAGVLTPLKGIHYLINAFALIAPDLPNARLIIIGRDENKTYAADLRKQVTELDLESRVQFVEALPQSELGVWMAKSSVLVLPSMHEGLGRVIIEAMAARTPVVASRVGGIPELVEDGIRGFLVSPGDETALAEKIRWILDNPDKGREMGECARIFAERLFSTESYLAGYKQTFEVAQRKFEHTEHAPSPL